MDSKYQCTKCEKMFRDTVALKRHLSRKTPCDAISRRAEAEVRYACDRCEKTYADRPSLYRHRRKCKKAELGTLPTQLTPGPASARPVIIHNTNIHVNALGQNQTFNLAPSPASPAPPPAAGRTQGPPHIRGWPSRWSPLTAPPHPFSPPGFGLSLEQLTAAVEALPESVREACRGGDQTAVVQLLMGILRQVHADPQERNVYVNPRRGDQALVYIPEHWVTCALDEAGPAMYRRIAESPPVQINQEPQNAQGGITDAELEELLGWT